MIKNSRKDKKIAILVLAVLATFEIYLFYISLPNFLLTVSPKNGLAKIIEIHDDDNAPYFQYNYYNEFDDSSYQFKRKVKTNLILDKLKEMPTINITYANYFPGNVKFENIDRPPSIFLPIIAMILVFFGIYLYVLVLKDKILLSAII